MNWVAIHINNESKHTVFVQIEAQASTSFNQILDPISNVTSFKSGLAFINFSPYKPTLRC